MRVKRHHIVTLCALAVLSTAAFAAETINYSYDAKGRLIKVVRSGTVNGGVTTSYTYDRANNRKTVVVAGSTNPTPP